MTTGTQRRVRLKPHDPFDLIRLLARSQPDARKAAAELVQNSLDAGAKHVEITWYTQTSRRALRVRDDGNGVFPELERDEALMRIARTIGHSHKLDLSPAERRQQMVLGRYGIGLLGFWSIGETMEIRSRVGGGQAWILRLFEDRAEAEVLPARARRLDEPPTFTEITVRPVHEGAANRIRPARLQAYLANELRGQLLERGATVVLTDRVARGRSRKRFEVKPRPFPGQPLETYHKLPVPGFESARLELYLVLPEEGRAGRVALSCGGTIVMDDVSLVDGDDVRRAPWDSGRLEGVIDFPDLYVAPGTRRGFVHDEPVEAFLAALPALEQSLGERLQAEEVRRDEARRASLAKDIRRAFRSVATRLPQYELLDVAGGRPGTSGRAPRPDPAPAAEGAPASRLPAPQRAIEVLAPEPEPPEPPKPPEDATSDIEHAAALFPPGPLHSLRVRPGRLRVGAGAERSLRAVPLDADGVAPAGDIELTWRLKGPGNLVPEGARALYTAPQEAGDARIVVTARQGDVEIEAEARVRVIDALDGDGRVEGIPEPRPIRAPSEPWRSRVRDGVWEYNEGHPDYGVAAASQAGRLRYLIHLFAKELVVRNFGGPSDEQILERMVEVLTCIDVSRKRT